MWIRSFSHHFKYYDPKSSWSVNIIEGLAADDKIYAIWSKSLCVKIGILTLHMTQSFIYTSMCMFDLITIFWNMIKKNLVQAYTDNYKGVFIIFKSGDQKLKYEVTEVRGTSII